jgi:hypothetical protein
MKRQTGKTTLLIIISHFTNARIITATTESARLIKSKAKQMNLSIPDPESCYTYKGCGKREKILIDELDVVLDNIFRNPILAVTITEEE